MIKFDEAPGSVATGPTRGGPGRVWATPVSVGGGPWQIPSGAVGATQTCSRRPAGAFSREVRGGQLEVTRRPRGRAYLAGTTRAGAHSRPLPPGA